MSLNFDLTAVKTRLGDRYDDITTSPETRNLPEGEQKWHPVTNHLIWQTMVVGLSSIDETNVDEWCFRLGLLRCINDRPDLSGGIGEFNLNRNDVVNHIGLKTNVTGEKRGAWVSRMLGRKDSLLARDAVRIGGFNATQEPAASLRINDAVAACKAKLTDPEAEVVE